MGSKIMKGAEPIFYKKGKIGCLLCHGFTGTPDEFREVAEYLSDKGISVIVPRLPGHGTNLEELIKTKNEDWYSEYKKAYQQLTSFCKEIFICGLSMGGLLTLKFAAENSVKGIITISTPMKFKFAQNLLLACLSGLFKNYAVKKSKAELAEKVKYNNISYDKYPISPANSVRKLVNQVKNELNKITAPILILQSSLDKKWIVNSSKIIYNSISSKDKQLIYLENSPHCLTIGPERDKAKKLIYEFIKIRSSQK